MLGNDVVDLHLAAVQSNWRKKGFLEKVFSPEEQQLVKNSSKPHQMVWLLWSMKEAAYKAHQRRFQLPRKLNWLSQGCSLNKMDDNKASGAVQIGNYTYTSTSEINRKYVYTVAGILSERSVKNVILETSSAAIKIKLLQHIALDYSLSQNEIILQKNAEGVPSILFKNEVLTTSFSLSSHGRYSGFTVAVNDV